MREDIAPPANYADARRRLAQSHGVWQAWLAREHLLPRNYLRKWWPPHPAPAYSYVRARQLTEQRVAFTLFNVAAGRVTMRAYATADPDRMSSVDTRPSQRDVTTLWIERDARVGSHAAGAPPRTIEELYRACAHHIARAEANRWPAPRLYFHPHGILMQCGFAEGTCADCEDVSVQDVSHFSLAHERPEHDVETWTCATEQGLMLPLSPALYGGFSCAPTWQKDPTFEQRRAAAQAARAQRLAHACNEDPLACETDEVTDDGVDDICQIDPAACPFIEARHAELLPWRFGGCSFPVFARAAHPLEVGKAEPLAEWAFPAINGTACGLDRRFSGYQDRPLPRLRYVRAADGFFEPIFTR